MAENLTVRLREVLAEPLAAAGVDLEELACTRAGRRRVVRVSVDADGGVSLDRVAELSTLVSAVLDDTDVMGDQPYVLEVSSRGVAKPLTLPRHWRRNRGRLVRLTRHDPPDTVEGRIVTNSDESVTLVLSGGEQVTLLFADIRRAVVQVELKQERAHGH